MINHVVGHQLIPCPHSENGKAQEEQFNDAHEDWPESSNA